MGTKIHMEQKIGEKWVPVSLSTEEFAMARTDKENFRFADLETPFSEFRDYGPRGPEAFPEDAKEAIRAKRFGPSWKAFINTLTEGSIFAIITGRGHEAPTIKRTIEWIIDNVLTEDQKIQMYGNCLKFAYFFRKIHLEDFDRSYREPLSQTPLIQLYLNNCSYYAIFSPSFREIFPEGSAINPESGKEWALDQFVEKCHRLAAKVGARSLGIGFSEDDPKTGAHIEKYFHEKSQISFNVPEVKLNLYKTTNRSIEGGERTTFRKGNI
jgi:hypothetical protein